MRVVEWLVELGGVANRATLVGLTSRAEVDRALVSGDVVRVGRGRYALPHVTEGLRAAHALDGLLSHTSAAEYLGWELKVPPQRPHVLVPEKRKVPTALRRDVVLHRGDLTPDQRAGPVTAADVTLTHCLRTLPFDEALAVADSALRNGVTPSTLHQVAVAARGPGAPRIRKVCALARGEAANPFESVLRAIAIEVGLNVVPQLLVVRGIRPDLVDPDLRIVLEADSFAWHGNRAALRRDARRYDLLVVDGWIVLRFAWEDVMHDPDFVRSVLVAAVALAGRQGDPPPQRRRAA